MVKKAAALLTAIRWLLIGSNVIAASVPDFVSLEEQTEQRATKIIIPRVKLQGATLAEALAFLKREALKHDPKHVGIRVESKFGPDPVTFSKIVFPDEELRNALNARITVTFRNMPLVEALREVTDLSECMFVFTPKGVELAPFPQSVDRLVTHTIPLPPAIFGATASPEKFGVPKSEIQEMRADLKQYFVDRGVQFSDKASCAFDASGMTMIITTTIDQLDLARVILTSLVHRKDILVSPKEHMAPKSLPTIPGLENTAARPEIGSYEIRTGTLEISGWEFIFRSGETVQTFDWLRDSGVPEQGIAGPRGSHEIGFRTTKGELRLYGKESRDDLLIRLSKGKPDDRVESRVFEVMGGHRFEIRLEGRTPVYRVDMMVSGSPVILWSNMEDPKPPDK